MRVTLTSPPTQSVDPAWVTRKRSSVSVDIARASPRPAGRPAVAGMVRLGPGESLVHESTFSRRVRPPRAPSRRYWLATARPADAIVSNRRPLPYHGRVRVLRAFTNALGRARNPCKQPQSGLYVRGGRFAVVVDLVDAEWTRCAPRSSSESPGLTRVPAGPAAAGLRVRPIRRDQVYFGSASNEPGAGNG